VSALQVIVVAYGSPQVLRQTLNALRHQTVCVVDNSSSAEVKAEAVRAEADYLDPGSNLGFGPAVNVGIRHAWARQPSSDVLLLNPDAVLDDGAVETLHSALLADQRIGMVAPRLRCETEEQRPAWPWPRPGLLWREAFGLLGRDRHRQDWLVGAVLMLKGAALEDVGLFDERFFLYSEEIDWQRRATLRGWRPELVEEVVAEHAGAGTSSDPLRRAILFHAGTETYIRKWFGRRGWVSYRAAALVGALLRSPLPGVRGAAARGRVAIYWRGPKRLAAGLDAASSSA
jgi:GT2 family glycosyltransferase